MSDTPPNCRFCGTSLTITFADLGETPLANSYVDPATAGPSDAVYPLHARVCSECLLVQVADAVPAEDIFSNYAYFSSYAQSWVEHASRYADMAVARFGLGPDSKVIEVASNDGYLLQHFVAKGIPVLGIEPAANVAEAAEARGVPTRTAFFGAELARGLLTEGISADLMAGNNVLAHVPDLNDFVAGLAILLAGDGVLTMEFPHLLRLIEDTQFDTIYHEHYSYFSLLAVEQIFARHSLKLFDVEELPTHGGSLRIFAGRADGPDRGESDSLHKVRTDEAAAALDKLETYDGFQARVEAVKAGLLDFLTKAKTAGEVVAAYGAAAKGNTLLNFCGVTSDQITFVADVSPHKQNYLLPGSRILVVSPDELKSRKPDHVLILPWNLKDEITGDHGYIREWGGNFVIAVPEITVLP